MYLEKIISYYWVLWICIEDSIYLMNIYWSCNKFLWRTQPSKPNSTITPWLLHDENPPHCSAKHLEWLSPHRANKLQEPFVIVANDIMSMHHHLGPKIGSNMFQMWQLDGRVLRAVKGSSKPSRSLYQWLQAPQTPQWDQYYSNNWINQ